MEEHEKTQITRQSCVVDVEQREMRLELLLLCFGEFPIPIQQPAQGAEYMAT